LRGRGIAITQQAAGNQTRSDSNVATSGGKLMISSVIAQLRTTDLAESIRFYTNKVGLTLEFQYQDFYAGIRAGNQIFHLKLVDEKDPSIEFVDKGEHFHLYLETDDAAAAADALKRNGVRLVKDVHETAWGTREFVIKDNQGHTLYFGESR
jgi:catechol 2,3-dioxygenase-like lactoylglutathione lyase family enzyme